MGAVAEDQAKEHHQAQDGPRGEDLGPVGLFQDWPPTVLHDTNSTLLQTERKDEWKLSAGANGRLIVGDAEQTTDDWSVAEVYKELRGSGRL